MSELEDWTAAVCRELGLVDVDTGRPVLDLVLDVARDAAHNVARPAAPLTTYLLGIAVGRGGRPDLAGELAERVTRLAEGWAGPAPGGMTAGGGAAATQSDQTATLRGTPTVQSRDQEPP
jgi:hypothetical protein